MAWITELSDAEATGAAAEAFKAMEGTMGMVPNTMRALSMQPEVMGAVLQLTALVQFGGSGLEPIEEEMIATVVSAANQCYYCTNGHGVSVLRAGGSPELAHQPIATSCQEDRQS